MRNENIEQIIISNLKTFDPEFIGLFGSFTEAGQNYRDIDILVKFRKNLSLLHLIKLENRLSDLLGIKADLITEGALKNKRVKENIKKQMKIIYRA